MAFTVTVTPFQLSPSENWTYQKFNQMANPTVVVTGVMADLTNFENVTETTKTFSVFDLANDILTCTAHGMALGQRCRVNTSSILPTGLVTQVEYFARPHAGDPANRITLHYTYAGALADTDRVDITSNGTGTQTVIYAVYETGLAVVFQEGIEKYGFGIVSPSSLPDFIGASSTTQGTRGAVPQPGPGDRTKYLRGDGTWTEIVSPTSVGNDLYLNENCF